ncbi:hypothetical protein GCM10010149_86400 [Nonomuraea roseoviolacea subsp. roseoviolacea]|uniref:hypothetical protein n=1 Tax=Nonomuraea roseoviolacea TaxID=103837 RepID=UPI0031E27217
MDNYDAGLALYIEGIAASIGASYFAVNPMLKFIAKYIGTSIGTILSSPGAINDEGNRSGDLGETVGKAAIMLKEAFDKVTDEQWEKMGREAAEQAKEKFGVEATDAKEVFDGMKDLLHSLANLSLAGAVVSGVVGATIVSLVLLSNATKVLGPLSASTDIATVGAGNSLMNLVRYIVGRNRLAFVTAASLTSGMAAIFMMRANSTAAKVTHPTGTKAPDFKQVYLPDLPRQDAKGRRFDG